MKTFTVLTACDCGCQQVHVWLQKADRVETARRKFKKATDPTCPLEILTVLPGHWTFIDRGGLNISTS